MGTVAQTLARGVLTLAETSESARADALLLLACALGRERAWIVAHGEARPSALQTDRFDELCVRRRTGRPLAYVLGSAWFYGREFYVDDRVLVPRPETEHLIDEALAFLATTARVRGSDRPLAVLDVGTGSGAIACTIAAESAHAQVDGTDVSGGALEVAERNARRLGVRERCRFHRGELASPVAGRRFDLVVANLPYIPTQDLPERPDPVGFEPRVALDGGADGLEPYRRFLATAPGLLEPEGLLLLEAAPPQMAGLVDLVRTGFAGRSLEVGEDFAGLARYVKVRAAAR